MKAFGIGALLLLLSLCPPLSGNALATSALGPVLRGYLARLSGDTETSQAAFREALRTDPDSPELRAIAAQAFAEDRRLGQALQIVEDGLRRNPDHSRLLLLKAKLVGALGRREDAVAAARAAIVRGAGGDAHELLVALLGTLNRNQEAADAAKAWSNAFPRSVDARFALGYFLLQTGDKKGSLGALDAVLAEAPRHFGALRSRAALEEEKNPEGAMALYRRALEINPHDVDSIFRLAQLLVGAGRGEEALSLFQTPDVSDRSSAEGSLRLSLLLAQTEKPGEAEAVLQHLARLQPEKPRLWFLLGALRQLQGNHAGALEAFEKVPADAAEFPDALLRRAYALDALKRKAEALALLSSQLETRPDDETFATVYSELVETERDQRRAIELLKGVLQKSGADRAQIFLRLGELHEKLKEWEKAAEYIKQSLALRPDDPQALNFLGYTYADHGVSLEEAERLVTRALELKPNEGYITDSLGWVYYKQGRYPEAVLQLRRATELSPKDAVIWDHLGDALRAAGDPRAAAEAYRKAEELDPTYAPAKEKLRELKP